MTANKMIDFVNVYKISKREPRLKLKYILKFQIQKMRCKGKIKRFWYTRWRDGGKWLRRREVSK